MNLNAAISAVVEAMERRLQEAKASVETQSATVTYGSPLSEFQIAPVSTKSPGFDAEMREAIDWANERAENVIREFLDGAMLANAWGWRDGSRDIVDTGELRDSLKFERSADGVSFFYTAPYAALVHNGGYIQPYGNANLDAVYVPGRPWVDAVMQGGGPVPSVNLDVLFSYTSPSPRD